MGIRGPDTSGGASRSHSSLSCSDRKFGIGKKGCSTRCVVQVRRAGCVCSLQGTVLHVSDCGCLDLSVVLKQLEEVEVFEGLQGGAGSWGDVMSQVTNPQGPLFGV